MFKHQKTSITYQTKFYEDTQLKTKHRNPIF